MSSVPSWLRPLILATTLAALALFTLGSAMSWSIDRDESMYVSAGAFAANGSLYDEIPFLQMPYLPWLYSAVFEVTGSEMLLLKARLVNWIALWIAIALLLKIGSTLGIGVWPPLGIAVLLLHAPGFALAASEASNHLLPAVAFLFAAALVTRRDAKPSLWLWLFAGIAMGIAIGLRLTWAAIAGAMLLVALSRGRRSAVAFGVGLIVALLPVVVVALRSPDAFWLQNLGYHALNRDWAIANEPTFKTGRSALGFELLDQMQWPIAWGWMIAIGGTLLARVRERASIAWGEKLVLILLPFATIASAAPSPLWPKHLVVLSVVVALGLLVSIARINTHRRLAAYALALGVAIGAGADASHVIRSIGHAFAPSTWIPIEVHRDSRALAVDALGTVATLAPLFALEAGLDVDPKWAAGVFLARVGPRFDDEQRSHLAGAGGVSIAATLDADPPDALLIGYEPRYDLDMIAWALARGYAPVTTESIDGLLLRRPAEDDSGLRSSPK